MIAVCEFTWRRRKLAVDEDVRPVYISSLHHNHNKPHHQLPQSHLWDMKRVQVCNLENLNSSSILAISTIHITIIQIATVNIVKFCLMTRPQWQLRCGKSSSLRSTPLPETRNQTQQWLQNRTRSAGPAQKWCPRCLFNDISFLWDIRSLFQECRTIPCCEQFKIACEKINLKNW